ncbi:hypothetical protein EGI26_04325 [Lacihabitans sp. CCS-44]|uniref:hypothetical protein n=1 Tax=Lacihabitans sp. CCS-44 TaxID=2487331 RepID=UPI0020CB8736|nr:hypothetical protein [Lacihabitans sp. CCS-44]MCP9754391.1 hypothetical protein [Lacihabitans sp. CCS-44]
MNPIDDFFREKLTNQEMKPSERANQLFMSKLENKKKKRIVPYRYFAMAASFFIVSLVGVYFYNKSKVSNDTLALTIPSSDEVISPSKTNEMIGKSDENITEVVPLIKSESTVIKEFLILKPNEVIALAVVPSERVDNVNEQKEISSTNTNSKVGIDSKTVLANKAEFKSENIEETLIFLTPILAMNQLNTFGGNPKILENSNSIVTTSSDEYFSDDKSLVTRVLDEVKNLKKGEKVDFNKLGFKPIEELTLDKEGFIVSETNQIKDKINWIKARLNNN